jgi:hypothetical protein
MNTNFEAENLNFENKIKKLFEILNLKFKNKKWRIVNWIENWWCDGMRERFLERESAKVFRERKWICRGKGVARKKKKVTQQNNTTQHNTTTPSLLQGFENSIFWFDLWIFWRLDFDFRFIGRWIEKGFIGRLWFVVVFIYKGVYFFTKFKRSLFNFWTCLLVEVIMHKCNPYAWCISQYSPSD